MSPSFQNYGRDFDYIWEIFTLAFFRIRGILSAILRADGMSLFFPYFL